MSFWDSIGGIFKGGGKPSAARDTGRTYILDGERMLEGRGGNSAGPLDRFQLLQRMAQFSEREGIKMQVVFAGRALREVANGAAYNGVQVFYVEQPANVIDQLDKLARRAGRNVVVITSDQQVEARVREIGAYNMRTSTLRKALEGNGESGEDRRDRGDRGDRRRQRPPRGGRRPDNRQQQDDRPRSDDSLEGTGQEDQQRERDRSGSAVDTTVKNLIDLVE
jgi:predicted RNA-binding protein with PIN domain